ncbi:MAG: hypothetical protein ACJ79K_01325 [Gemmatimonadaceae bacterium]
MALRDFKDEAGRDWRVWDITADKLHPSTRAEDHMQGVLEGWLVFEAVDGSAKARLYPIPPTWRTASQDELRRLRRLAEPTRGTGEYERFTSADRPTLRAPASGGGDPSPAQRAERTSPEARSFRYPGGRYWSVAEYVISRPGGAVGGPSQHVLRFTAGARTLDVTSWPSTWRSFSDHQLADLLWRSFPRTSSGPPTIGGYRRRRGELDAGG